MSLKGKKVVKYFDKKHKIGYYMTIFIYLVIFFMETKENLIIEAWIKLFWKFWPRRTSVDQIVKEARIAKGTFYLYFKNKEELYETIIHNDFSYWEKIIKELVDNKPNLKERIIKKMMLSLDFFERNEIMRNILFWNEDYDFWKINKEYIVNKHIKLLNIMFDKIDNIDCNLISRIMWFYINVINIKYQFKNEEEYNNFVLCFAWIITNGLFSDYKSLVKKI